MIPTTRHIGEQAKERRERKENQNSNIPMMETKVIHPMRVAKERADRRRENPRRSQPPRETEEQPAIQQTAPPIEPTYAGWTDQDWDQSWTWNEHGWYSSHETSSTGHHPREADPIRYSFRTQSVRHNKSQHSGNKADGACHQPSAQPDLCDSGQWMYQIYGQLACNPAFYSGHRTNEGHHLL